MNAWTVLAIVSAVLIGTLMPLLRKDPPPGIPQRGERPRE